MRIILQRVKSASVSVDGKIISQIGAGLLLLVGIEAGDGIDDIHWLAKKVVNLRIFNDEQGMMNLSLADTGLDILAVSQFTLFASLKKGNRPSYSRALPGPQSEPVFNTFVRVLSQQIGKAVPTGQFGADMQISLVNDGPVTLMLDSKAPQ